MSFAVLDEGFCVRCGKRVTHPTTRRECEQSPDCGPFRQEGSIPDDVLERSTADWHPQAR